MTGEGKGRLFKRKDGKYLVYLPKDLCEDSMFPFKNLRAGPRGGGAGQKVHVTFKRRGPDSPAQLLISEILPPK